MIGVVSRDCGVRAVRDPLSAVPLVISLYLSFTLYICTIYLPVATAPLPAQLNT